jgi:type VI protein secretion system component Hcp
MATDAYIKFGEGSGTSPYGTPLPDIEGDSTDEGHYWWCELRGYDFALEAGERDSSAEGDKDKEKPKPSFKKVTIKKRVDWASTQLFMKCCYAAAATTKKTVDEQDPGKIDRITIDICKQSDDKFPFIIVRYFGVRIVGYSIDMSGPEPAETLSFVFEKLELEYQRTNPFTGAKMGATEKALNMENYTPKTDSTQSGASSVAGGGSTSSSSTGAAAAAAAAAGGGGGSADGNGAPASNGSATASPTEVAVSANFPGLWGGNGFGILPD